MTVVIRFQHIFLNKSKIKYHAFWYLSQNGPFEELNHEKYKHGHWTIKHSCIFSTQVKDLFCEIVVLLSFLFFCRQACYLETRTSGAPIAVIWKPSLSVYNVTIHFWLFEPLSISKRTFFDAYEQTWNRSHCKTAAANSFCSKSHLCTSGTFDCVRNDGAMPPHTCQDFYFSQSRSRDSPLESSQFQTSEIQIRI